MFTKCLSVEWMKIRRLKIWLLLLLAPAIGVTLALSNYFANYESFMEPGDNGWLEAWTQVQIFYGPLILPILTGVYAALICRSEHIGGGWKQLLALPIHRSHIYISKLLIVFILLALTQAVMMGMYLVLGSIWGVPNVIPWDLLLGFMVRGWLASLPLAALQMIASVKWRSFGIPLAINIGLSIPGFILSYSKYGQYYPWSLPNLAMSPVDESPIRSYPLFYSIIFGVFIISTIYGIRNFQTSEFH
jgi:lantibiotic transport system permease protein